MQPTSRRKFVWISSLACLGRARSVSAAEKIRVGLIGCGGISRADLTTFLSYPEVDCPVVCDVDDAQLAKGIALVEKLRGRRPDTVKDFRRVIERKDVDVVLVCTPDHWHALPTVLACQEGKDVYVEKPLATTVAEGRAMVEAARRHGRVVQMGTQWRSGPHYQEAIEFVQSGKLGKIRQVRAWAYLDWVGGIGNPPDRDPPAGVDYDFWLGPAPLRPFNPNRFHFNFRWFWDYAGGMMTDWGVHWLDIVQMAYDEAMPTAITALGGKLFFTDNRETPDTLQVTYEYPGFIATYEYRNGNGNSMFKQGGGILFHGSKATMFLDRRQYFIEPEPNSGVEPEQVKSVSSGNLKHWANWLECIRTRQRPESDIEKCYRSTATCLLGNVALRSKLRVDWDGQNVKQSEARRYQSREYRKPWKLTV